MTTFREGDHPRGPDGRWVNKSAVGLAFAARDRTKAFVGGSSTALVWSASAGFRPSQLILAGIATGVLGFLAVRHRKGLGRAAVGTGKGVRWGYRKVRPLFGAPVTSQAASKPRLWHPVNRVRWHARGAWKRRKARWKRKLTPKMVVRYRKSKAAWDRRRNRQAGLPPGSRSAPPRERPRNPAIGATSTVRAVPPPPPVRTKATVVPTSRSATAAFERELSGGEAARRTAKLRKSGYKGAIDQHGRAVDVDAWIAQARREWNQ